MHKNFEQNIKIHRSSYLPVCISDCRSKAPHRSGFEFGAGHIMSLCILFRSPIGCEPCPPPYLIYSKAALSPTKSIRPLRKNKLCRQRTNIHTSPILSAKRYKLQQVSFSRKICFLSLFVISLSCNYFIHKYT